MERGLYLYSATREKINLRSAHGYSCHVAFHLKLNVYETDLHFCVYSFTAESCALFRILTSMIISD
jgi:hypothetical protein